MSHLDELDQIAREIRQRVTRIESRICRIGDALDISLRNPKEGIRVISVSEEAIELSIDCFDVALSELISFVERSGFSNLEVDVYNGRNLIATLLPKGKVMRQ